jgi:hypothetical protein
MQTRGIVAGDPSKSDSNSRHELGMVEEIATPHRAASPSSP